MYKLLSDKRGEMSPLFLKIVMGAVCVLILGCIGISAILDRQNEIEYQKWARGENQKVFDASRETRLTERQLLKVKRELNDSFYQRLEHDLPVRILIVGDAYGNGFGASNRSEVWSRLLQVQLKKKFGVKAEVENITLSGMNGGYGAWAKLMSLPDGTAGKVLSAAGAVKDKQGAYTGEVLSDAWAMKDKEGLIPRAEDVARTGERLDAKAEDGTDTGARVDANSKDGTDHGNSMDTKIVAASRENEYDLCIVSLGITDEPQMFELYYEGILREVRRKFEKCSIISLLANQALTAPELGYADDNYDALYRISKHYDAAVLNVGLEITDPDAAEKGATISQIPYGLSTSESLAADMRADGISGRKAEEIAAKDLAERSAYAEEAIRKYTINGLYLNNAGQKFLSDRIIHLIEKKVSKSTGYDPKEVAPLRKEVTTLDMYHYFPVSELVRLDDFTYVLAENKVKASTHNFGSIVGLDYDLIPGNNDVYAAVGDGTESFGRITQKYEGIDREHFIMPLNEGYSCEKDGNLIIGFSTKKQADTLHGVILGGDFTLPSYFDGYQQVPYIGLTDEDGNPVALNKDGKPAGDDSSVEESSAASESSAAETAANAADGNAAETAANAKTRSAARTAANAGTGNTTGNAANAGTGNATGTSANSKTANSAETSATAKTANTTETTAATFGNDQIAQGNAVAVSESLSNLTATSQAEESINNQTESQQTAESLNNQAEGQQAAEDLTYQTEAQQAAEGVSNPAETQQAAENPSNEVTADNEASSGPYAASYPEGEVVYIHNGPETSDLYSGSVS